LDERTPTFFRFRELPGTGGKIILSNHEGDWLVASPDEFRRFAAGEIEPGSPLETRLREKNFLRDGRDAQRAASRLAARKRFLHYGPNLHILVVTLRCNETCVYCHASRADMDAVDTDMTRETAEKTVDLVLRTTSPSVTIEFQGGEPLVAF